MPLPELSDEQRAWYILQGYEVIEIVGCRIFKLDGKWHRHDGPALEWEDGRQIWYLNDKPVLTQLASSTHYES